MPNFSIEALLGLYSIPTIGPTRMRKLISVFKSPQAVFEASMRQLMELEGIDQKTALRIKDGPDEGFVKRQLEQIKRHDVEILTYWDDSYPVRLKKIYDPPAFLFIKGNKDILEKTALAIVGTRTPTSYGKMITERFCSELVQNNFAIISGFARGIDSIAHATAIRHDGGTIAVLGNGIDQVYPPENIKLIPNLLKKGAIITEYPMGTKPDAINFPKRNRIISGISVGVLIPEAGSRSGAIITAMYAADQNREVFAVPGPITSGKSSGTNKLIKEGAVLVEGVEDILAELNKQLNLHYEKKNQPLEITPLQGNAKLIYDNLSDEAIHVDQLAFKTGLSPSETLSTLLILELQGLIRQLAGKMFVRL